MNVVRSRIPIMGMALTAVLIAGASLVAMPLEAQRPTVRKPAVNVPAAVQPIAPCCGITAIDARAGLVTAKNLETGATFQFRVTDRRLLGSLAVGQKVYADDAGEKAGLTPAEPCCDIVAGADKVTPAQPINAVRPAANPRAAAQPMDPGKPPQLSMAAWTEYRAIVGPYQSAQLMSADPVAVRRFNARLAPIRAELEGWADKHGIRLITRSCNQRDLARALDEDKRSASSGENTVASCPNYVRSGNEDCDLIGATFVGGKLICEYNCYPSAELDRQDKVQVMQEQS